jgi:hypothetical protein
MVNLVLRNSPKVEQTTEMLILPRDGPSHALHLNAGLDSSSFVALKPLLKILDELSMPLPRAPLVLAVLSRGGGKTVLRHKG